MKAICILLGIAACVPIYSADETLAEELPNTASENNNLDNEHSVFEREGRQLKWLQPASYVLSNLNKPLAPGEDPAGRFFKVMAKGNSVTQLQMLASVLKQALEDFNDDSKGFSKQFDTLVKNEVRRFASTPSVAARFSANLAISISNATTNLQMAIRNLLEALIALGDSLGLNIGPLLMGLNQILPLSSISGGPGGAGGLLGGLGK